MAACRWRICRVLLITVAAGGWAADLTAALPAAPADRPNILWLSVEDMSPWIGPYGDMTVPTPNLDRLAREGVVYDNAFATSPVCAPARSSLITGMFCTRIGTMQMRNGNPSKAAVAMSRTIPNTRLASVPRLVTRAPVIKG